jgi:5-methylcytosine-specific restriction endonuclease McrA
MTYTNQEDRKRNRHAYHKKNSAKIRARVAKWASENPEAVKAAHARWLKKHPEEARTMQRNWHKQHPEAGRASARSRRARRRNAPGEGFTAADESAILAYWDWKCAYCACDLRVLSRDQIHMDHVVPLVTGGAHDTANIVPSCDPCNRRKGPRGVFFVKDGLWRILPELAPYSKAA